MLLTSANASAEEAAPPIYIAILTQSSSPDPVALDEGASSAAAKSSSVATVSPTKSAPPSQTDTIRKVYPNTDVNDWQIVTE
jgi:hypothetical protein